MEEYIEGGGFEAFYQGTRSQIDSLVEQDPTAFYTYEEYEEALDTFYEAVQLRGQSISGQIEGTIPSTEEEQRASDALIDASHLDLSVMGSMGMGDRMQDWNGEEKKVEAIAQPPEQGRGRMPNERPGDMPDVMPDEMPGGMQNMNFDRSDAGRRITDNLILYGVCTGILVIALVSAKGYRRRKH